MRARPASSRSSKYIEASSASARAYCGEAERCSLRLSLPREVAAGKVDANLKRGVLRGRVPRARATNGKRIEVAED
jgi:HSP20 family molecular chaperone IbpA